MREKVKGVCGFYGSGEVNSLACVRAKGGESEYFRTESRV